MISNYLSKSTFFFDQATYVLIKIIIGEAKASEKKCRNKASTAQSFLNIHSPHGLNLFSKSINLLSGRIDDEYGHIP